MQQTTYTNGPLFDDLVGAGEQLWRHVKAERPWGVPLDPANGTALNLLA
jgi:hypothetical protein